VFLSGGSATKEMNGVAAHDLQQVNTLDSVGLAFGQIAAVAEVNEGLRASRATFDHRVDG
jgi:hypothetical protein